MSKRPCPRSSNARVMGTGSSRTNLPSLPRPAYMALSSRRNPRATVSCGIGRAFCPLAKNSLSDSGFALAWSYISLRHPTAIDTETIANNARPAEEAASRLHIVGLHGVEAQEELVGAVAVELGVPR